MARFDWYQATIPAPVHDVLEALGSLKDGLQLARGRGMHGFAHEARLDDELGTVVKVWHGGCHPYPHVVFSGESTQAGVELIRTVYPDHKVSRADACEDFEQPVFDPIQSAMLQAAKQHRVKVDTRGDHLLTKEGRTLYLGSAKSACRMRLYDKAAQLRSQFAKDPLRLAEVPEHLVRLEAQVRPSDERAKRLFSTIEPSEVMGCSAWQREVWKLVMGLDVDPVQVRKPWRQADDDRAYAYLLAQYGKLLQRKCQEHGSWACLGMQIGHDLAERAKADSKRGPAHGSEE